jgi:glutathione synthase/RimK-type ligase-like ATP-grasp enzyme
MSYNKWYIYEALMEESGLKEYIPETYKFTKDNLFKMLKLHNEIIIKPIYGLGGKGVRKVTKMDNGGFKIHHENVKSIIKDKNLLYDHLKDIEAKQKKSFIIQNYISLAKINGRPIDIRNIVQRKKGTTDWMITGKFAKVAREGYLVTNLKSGGDILSIEQAFEKSNIKDVNMQKTLQVIDEVSLLATACLSKHFKNQTIWGLDLAVDEEGHVWFIEANKFPLVSIFRRLDDRSMYETIISIKDYNKKQ